MTDEHETPLPPAQEARCAACWPRRATSSRCRPRSSARMDRVLDELADEPGRARARRRPRRAPPAGDLVAGRGGGRRRGRDRHRADRRPRHRERRRRVLQRRRRGRADAGAGAARPSSPPRARRRRPREVTHRATACSTGARLRGPGPRCSRCSPTSSPATLDRLRQPSANAAQADFAATVRWLPLRDTDCRAVDWGAGLLVPIQYGEDPAGLVLRGPSVTPKWRTVYLCGDPRPVRSLTLPVP